MSKNKVTSWPRDRPDPTKRYRAEKDGFIYKLAPCEERPGYWRASRLQTAIWSLEIKRAIPAHALGELFSHGFFPSGLELSEVKAAAGAARSQSRLNE
jgi:hypothetical protein